MQQGRDPGDHHQQTSGGRGDTPCLFTGLFLNSVEKELWQHNLGNNLKCSVRFNKLLAKRSLQAPDVFDATVGEREFVEKACQSHIPFSVSQVHRLVVVDEQEVVRGIVSLSDILQALVLTDGYAGESSHSFVGLRRPVLPLIMFALASTGTV